MSFLPSRSSPRHNLSPIEAARIEQQQAQEAHRTLIDATEQIRRGELQPTRRTMHELAQKAMFLAETDAVSPMMTSDTLATANANLHAAHADISPDGQVIADLSDKFLEEVNPYSDHDPSHHLRVATARWAIEHTTPTMPFEAAYETAWDRLSQDYGFEYQGTTLVAPSEIIEPRHKTANTGQFDPFAEDDDVNPPTTPLY